MSKLFFCSAPDPSGGAYSAPSGPLAGFGEPFRGRQERKGKGGDGGTGKEKRQGRERGEWRRGERASGNSFLPTPSAAVALLSSLALRVAIAAFH